MSVMNNMTEMLGYLEQCAGFYYTQNPVAWGEAFKEVASNSKLVSMVTGEASAEITNISYAYNTVGKDIYATAESGLKNAPVIESVFTERDTETAVESASALGTYIAGVAGSFSLATALAGVLSGLGIGILGYETAPEGWVDLSNAIFGTNLSYDDATPLITTYVRGMFAKKSHSDAGFYTYLPGSVLANAFDYFKAHILGGTDYSFLENTVWEPVAPSTVPTHCTSGQSYLSNLNLPITGEITEEYITYIGALAKEYAKLWDDIEMPDFNVSGILNSLYSLYPNYHNANLFCIIFKYVGRAHTTTELFELVINGYRYNPETKITNNCNIHEIRNLIVGTQAGSGYQDSDFNYRTYDWSYADGVAFSQPLFSFKRDLTNNTDVVRDDGNYYDRYTNYPNIGPVGYSDDNGTLQQVMVDMWNVGGSDSLFPRFDEEFTNKGYIIEPKSRSEVDAKQLANNKPKTNFQDQYAYWYGGKKDIAQPSPEEVPTITPYIPTPLPLECPDPRTLISHGVGVADDPESLPVAPPYALPDSLPLSWPDPAGLVDPSGDQQRAIDAYNESRVTPNTSPEPIPGTDPNPQYPENPPSDPSGDSGSTPSASTITGVETSGMVSVYNPSKQQIIDFSSWLWTGNVFENMKKLLMDPMDAIIGLHILYATPTTGSTSNIIVGWLDSNVSSKVVTKQYTEFSCGSVTIPEYFGNALDFEPYTSVHLYLPFIGIQAIKANDVIGKKVTIDYGVDVLTGACLATITTEKDGSKIKCYTFPGNCAVQIPLTGGNYAQVIRSIASVAMGVAGSIATANPLPAIGGVIAGAMGSTLDVAHSGSLGSNAGVMGVRKPYFIITRRKPYDASVYNQYYGYPANKTVVLGACQGFTRVKSVHIETIGRATDSEKAEMETLLKQGVIIK